MDAAVFTMKVLRSGSILALASLSLAAPAAGLVSPSANATVEANGSNFLPFNASSSSVFVTRYQQVFPASDLSGLGGPVRLTSISFRPDSGTVDDLSYALSGSLALSTTGRDENTLSNTLDSNPGADATTVFSGSKTLSTSRTPVGDGTYAFDVTIDFSTPFVYDPSRGNLLIDLSFTPDPSNRLVLDAGVGVQDGVARAYVRNDGGTSANTTAVVARFEAEPVPEPASLAALGLGAVAVLRRRKRA